MDKSDIPDNERVMLTVSVAGAAARIALHWDLYKELLKPQPPLTDLSGEGLAERLAMRAIRSALQSIQAKLDAQLAEIPPGGGVRGGAVVID